MKKYLFVLMSAMLLAMIGMTSCSSDDIPVVNHEPVISHDVNKVVETAWKLYGFGTVSEDDVPKIPDVFNYQGIEKYYVITFTDENVFMGHTLVNQFGGQYSIDGNNIVILNLGSDMAGETAEGYKLFRVLRSGPLRFETKGDQLLLYYNEGQEYLLFDKLTYEDRPYVSFLKEGKTWNYSYKDHNGKQCMMSLIVRGDTTINGLAYKKIYNVNTNEYQYALREKGKKVYCKHLYDDTPKLLYDFSKNLGEKIGEKRDQDFRIVKRVYEADLVRRGDYLLRGMTVVKYKIPLDNTKSNEKTGICTGRWVEGLGSLYGLDNPYGYPNNYYTFDSCWIGDELFANRGVFGGW